ncbi:MAG: ferric reductase-like transmembrane domain-containing protein [Chloroflexi bacterium]|nr:ferric reductase-like transmembrane domain-containing protein [Chloroflexota bacterium]
MRTTPSDIAEQAKPAPKSWLRQNWPRLLAHAISLALLAELTITYLYGGLANPERYIMLRSGTLGLLLLLASLACTPLSTLLGWKQFIPARRPLGLYGFTFITIHLLTYVLFDSGQDWEIVLRDLGERQAMSVGLVSFLLLIPLALTSTQGWQRRLGKRWRLLHRLIYFAAPLAVLHVLLLERDFRDAAYAYTIVVAALLLSRLPPLRQAIIRLRQRQ